jgi:phosphohistidine phosphatase
MLEGAWLFVYLAEYMKTLILCRHAKSDWPEGVPDIRRPLKQRGIRDANFLGDLLRGQAFRPDRIITSPAQRARQTAEIVATCISYPGEISEAPEIYYEGEEALIGHIHQLPEEWDTVMIFGHNPTLEDGVRKLLGSEAPFHLPTSAMACIESMANQWPHFLPRNLHLRWLLIPRLKRKQA